MQKRLHWQVFWCFCRRTFEMLWWKRKDEGRKAKMRAAAFVDVCRCDSLKEAHDDQRRWWSACLRWKLVCGDEEETSFEHNLLCVQYTHLHSRQLCTCTHMCEKCANDETEYDYMHLRRYDKRILLEELCPGNLSPFCFTIFSHSSKIQQINELFLFVSCKM